MWVWIWWEKWEEEAWFYKGAGWVEKSWRIEEGVLYLSDVVAGRVSDSEGVLSVVSTVVWFIPSIVF